MQTTLLTFAIAVILALLAALVAPFFIDWGTYRSVFEREAGRLTGLTIKVDGAIEARLLPSPRLELQNVAIGSGAERLRARSLTIEFALGPLMRGEWRASEMRIAGPRLRLALDAAGRISAPGFALNLDPDALSVERLGIEDGTAVFADAASGATLTLDKIWFNGELRSLLGPLRGEGAFQLGGELYPYRVTSGRLNEAGALKLRVNVDPVNLPLNVEIDGSLALAQDKPQFEGTLSLSRPVGIAPRNAASLVTQPWRVGGKLKVTSASALMEQVEFSYGSEAQAVRLSGTAELKFGAQPRFDGVLSARQIDLDKFVGEGAAAVNTPPAVTLRRLAGLAGQAFTPPFPIQIGLGLDQVTLGGADISGLRGDISTAAGGWSLDRFEFRAPGFTQVRLSGALALTPAGVTFTGPADIAATDTQALAAWLEGRQEKEAGGGPGRPLQLRGEVTLGSEKVAIERLNASFDRGAISGRFAYVFATPGKAARVDAVLNAPELDIDAADGFIRALLAGSSVERPGEAALALEIGRSSFAGFEAGKTSARLQYDQNGIRIERLSIDNLGGANLSASGQIALAPAPRGSLALNLDARDLAGVNALLARYVPAAAARLRVVAGALAPARLAANLKIEDAAPGNRASIAVQGTAGALKVNLDAQAGVDLTSIPAAAMGAANSRLRGRIEAENGQVLVALFGLERYVAVGKEAGSLAFNAAGAGLGAFQLDGKLVAGGLDAAAAGNVQFIPGEFPQLSLKLNLTRADLAPLRGGAALPASLTAQLALADDRLALDQIAANIAGSSLRGKLALDLGSPRKLSGEIDSDALDLPAMVAVAIGMPASGGLWNWPADPFASRLPDDIDGTVALHAMRAALAPNLSGRELRGRLRLANGEVALEDVTATLGGGDLKGRVAFKDTPQGLSAKATLALANAELATLLPNAARPPLSGKLTLNVDVEGAGRSPQALIGSLQGSGKLTLSGGQIAGLDPRAFAAATRAVDQGLAVEAARIESLAGSALASGQLKIRQATGELSISAGQVRLNSAKASGEGADLAVTGALDLTIGTIDARLILSGSEQAGGARPDIFLALRGPLAAPERSVDVSAFTSWLTLRGIERQSKKLEQIESPAVAPMAPAAPIEPPPQTTAPVAPVTPPKPARPPAARTGQAPALPPPINIMPVRP